MLISWMLSTSEEFVDSQIRCSHRCSDIGSNLMLPNRNMLLGISGWTTEDRILLVLVFHRDQFLVLHCFLICLASLDLYGSFVLTLISAWMLLYPSSYRSVTVLLVFQQILWLEACLFAIVPSGPWLYIHHHISLIRRCLTLQLRDVSFQTYQILEVLSAILILK